jgi:hypothetical protein
VIFRALTVKASAGKGGPGNNPARLLKSEVEH